MNTLSITVRYRPIRIGWCIRAEDFAAMRNAIKLTFTMWGGRYNPIIPIDNFEAASSLVRLFRVDVLWPVSDDEAIKEFIKRFPHLPNPFFQDELFIPYSNDERSPQLLDIYHPIRRLHEEHFKNNPSPNTTVTIFEWQAEDPLADVLLTTFGAIPPTEVTGTDYLGLLKQQVSAETVVLNPKEPLPQLAGNVWSVSTFCHAFMQQHYSVLNHWGHPGIYVGNASDFDDIVTFWNLRATGTSLMFFDPNQTTRFEPNQTDWLKLLRARPKERFESDNSIAIWFRESMPEPDISMFGQGLRLRTAGNGTWNGLNIKAPCMYFSEGSALAAIGEDSSGLPKLSFQLPTKPFNEDTYLYDQHLVVSIDPGIGLFGNDRATLQTPYVPELNEYFGRQYYFEWDKARVEPDGMGIISIASRSDLSLNALDVVELVKRVFSVTGIDAQPSKPGLIASRLIQQMGGLQGCRVFKIGGVRMLLEKFGPDTSFSHQCALQAIGKGDSVNGIFPISEYNNLFIESRPYHTQLRPHDVFSYLLKKGVYRTGLNFDCPSCLLEFWLSLDDVRPEVACEYCGHRFNVAPYLRDKNVWRYRRSGLFGRADNQEGAIPVILTIQQLHTTFLSREMLYAPAMTLESKSIAISKCETDFVTLAKSPLDGKIDIAIGECKTRKQISDEDVNNLRAIADAFPSERFNVYIIFSKLGSFSSEELARVRQLNNEYRRRVILFTERELEPYHLYERTAKEFNISRHAASFEKMANITEQVFFSQAQEIK